MYYSCKVIPDRVKRYLSKNFVFLISVLLPSCEKSNLIQPLTPKGNYLNQVTETRYTPSDSITVTYLYNADEQLINEQYSQQPSRRAYSIISYYQPAEFSFFKDINNQYRFYTKNKDGKVNSIKKYFAQSTTFWSIYDSDTLFYKGDILTSQNHQDYYFLTDYQGKAFKFPLWLTKRYYSYDNQLRMIAEIDSVFRTHDFPIGSLVINESAPIYLFTNQTIFEYNNQNKVSHKITESGADRNSSLVYSNGFSIYQQFGGRGYSTYDQSFPGRFMSGVSTYNYEYGTDSLVSRKTDQFLEAKTQKVYTSSFVYSYKSFTQ